MQWPARDNLRQLNPFTSCRRCGAYGIYPQTVFRAIVERECHRSDRNSHDFSIVVFHLPNARKNCRLRSTLIEVLADRVRCTDEVGWLEDTSIGVLLPETHVRGGWLFAEKVRAEIALRDCSVPAQVYTYPSHCTLSKDREQGQLWLDCFEGEGIATTLPGDGMDSFRRFDLHPLPQAEPAPADQDSPLPDSLELLLQQPPALWKRMLDVAGSSIGLVALLPVMLITAALIKMQSPGPVFFRQRRVGYRGTLFDCLKFRTMEANADTDLHRTHVTELLESDRPMVKLDSREDPRLIPVGRFLRMTGLDELPQLINVLRGEMSLIGPRPCIPYEYEQYERWQRKRTDALPGITGLWQVSGKNRTTFSQMMRLDIAYARERSLWLDLKILLRTLPAVIRQVRDESGA